MTATGMEADWTVVDLGTKKAGALDVFRKNHGLYFPRQDIPRSACLGVDRNPRYRAAVESKGYAFELADLLHYDFPPAAYYTAFDCLEHMPSLAEAQLVLVLALRAATRGVWLRLPSFEADETNEARLSPLGLRFAWTTWGGHSAPVTCQHVRDTVEAVGGWKVRFKPNLKVRTTRHRSIVPRSAPPEALTYHPQFGPRPSHVFRPPLVGQWETIITRTDS